MRSSAENSNLTMYARKGECWVSIVVAILLHKTDSNRPLQTTFRKTIKNQSVFKGLIFKE